MRNRVPDTEEAWLVHADGLLERGDPRALFVQQQQAVIAHRDLHPADQRRLKSSGLTGPFERPTRHKLRWFRGYWFGFGSWSRAFPAAHWESVLSHPSARFLREVSMRWVDGTQFPRTLARHRPPLTRLHWNDRDTIANYDMVFDALPELLHAQLWCPGRFDGIPQLGLRSLSVNPGDDRSLLLDLGRWAEAGGFASLDDLEIWGTNGWKHIEPILQHTTPRRLALKGSVDDTAVPVLTASRAFEHAEELVMEGFWPGERGMDAMITALSARETPLDRYRSTGWVPDERRQAAVDRWVSHTQITG